MSGLEVIAIAGLVINGMSMFNELVRTWLQFRKERKEAKAAKALDEGLEHEMEATTTQLAFGRLWLEYAKSQNADPSYSAAFGEDTKKRQTQISIKQDSLERQIGTLKSLVDGDNESSWPEIKKLSRSARKTVKEINKLAEKQFQKLSIAWKYEALPALPNHTRRVFCSGALRLQTNLQRGLSVLDIATSDQAPEGQFICKYCHLQVGGSTRRTSEFDLVFARSHLIACAAFGDFKALYKCLPCYLNHGDKDFASTYTLAAHISSCHIGIDLQTCRVPIPEETSRTMEIEHYSRPASSSESMASPSDGPSFLSSKWLPSKANILSSSISSTSLKDQGEPNKNHTSDRQPAISSMNVNTFTFQTTNYTQNQQLDDTTTSATRPEFEDPIIRQFSSSDPYERSPTESLPLLQKPATPGLMTGKGRRPKTMQDKNKGPKPEEVDAYY